MRNHLNHHRMSDALKSHTPCTIARLPFLLNLTFSLREKEE
jgi:hypothetical protein